MVIGLLGFKVMKVHVKRMTTVVGLEGYRLWQMNNIRGGKDQERKLLLGAMDIELIRLGGKRGPTELFRLGVGFYCLR